MADYARDLKKRLRENGCLPVRKGKGDYEIWSSPISNRRFVVDNAIKSRHTSNEVLKQAGRKKQF